MNLGRSGLSVSRLCLGTMNFGPETDEATAHAVMDAALAGGINFFDTANRYGAPQLITVEEVTTAQLQEVATREDRLSRRFRMIRK